MIAAEVETPTFFSDHNYSAFRDHTEMEEWCSKMIGAQAQFRDHVSDEYPWTYSFMGGKTVWHFAREEYATMFTLRWL
jgi:hypothetical protein